MRSATGGSLPAFTSSASCGASLKVFGLFAASVTTSGPSSFPMRALLPIWASAAAASAAVRSPARTTIRNRDGNLRLGIRPPWVIAPPPFPQLVLRLARADGPPSRPAVRPRDLDVGRDTALAGEHRQGLPTLPVTPFESEGGRRRTLCDLPSRRLRA